MRGMLIQVPSGASRKRAGANRLAPMYPGKVQYTGLEGLYRRHCDQKQSPSSPTAELWRWASRVADAYTPVLRWPRPQLHGPKLTENVVYEVGRFLQLGRSVGCRGSSS